MQDVNVAKSFYASLLHMKEKGGQESRGGGGGWGGADKAELQRSEWRGCNLCCCSCCDNSEQSSRQSCHFAALKSRLDGWIEYLPLTFLRVE